MSDQKVLARLWHQRRERWLVELGLAADQVPGSLTPKIGDAPCDDTLIQLDSRLAFFS